MVYKIEKRDPSLPHISQVEKHFQYLFAVYFQQRLRWSRHYLYLLIHYERNISSWLKFVFSCSLRDTVIDFATNQLSSRIAPSSMKFCTICEKNILSASIEWLKRIWINKNYSRNNIYLCARQNEVLLTVSQYRIESVDLRYLFLFKTYFFLLNPRISVVKACCRKYLPLFNLDPIGRSLWQ